MNNFLEKYRSVDKYGCLATLSYSTQAVSDHSFQVA